MIKSAFVKQMLNWQEIEPELQELSRKYLVCHEILERVDSTNNWALEVCGNQIELPAVCLAEQQLAGKGRNGRKWVSPYAKNIYMSLAAVFLCPVVKLSGLSIAIGVELVRLLRNHGVEAVLKWPNDILVDGRKLAGVLVETRVKAQSRVCVVMGVGLNCRMEDFDARAIDQDWIDLSRAMKDKPVPGRNLLAAELINALVNVCIQFQESGLDSWRDAWNEFDACNAREVEIIEGECIYRGIGAGINEAGALKISVDGKIRELHSSEVSVRVIN